MAKSNIAALLEKMNKPLREEAEWLLSWYRKRVSTHLRDYYEAGIHLNQIDNENRTHKQKTNNFKYGTEEPTEHLARLLDDPTLVSDCRQFAGLFSKAQLEFMCQPGPHGYNISWSAIRMLFGIKNADARDKLLHRAVAEEFRESSMRDALQQLDKTESKRQTRVGSGPRHQPPKNMNQLFEQEQAVVGTLNGKSVVWCGAGGFEAMVKQHVIHADVKQLQEWFNRATQQRDSNDRAIGNLQTLNTDLARGMGMISRELEKRASVTAQQDDGDDDEPVRCAAG